MTLNFSHDLDSDSISAAGAFTVTAGGTDQTPTSVTRIGTKALILTLGTAVTSGQTVTVSYDRPADNPLQHSGVPLASFTDHAVTNTTP